MHDASITLTCAILYRIRSILKYAWVCTCQYVRNAVSAEGNELHSEKREHATTVYAHRALRLFKVMTTVISSIVRRKGDNLSHTCEVLNVGRWRVRKFRLHCGLSILFWYLESTNNQSHLNENTCLPIEILH